MPYCDYRATACNIVTCSCTNKAKWRITYEVKNINITSVLVCDFHLFPVLKTIATVIGDGERLVVTYTPLDIIFHGRDVIRLNEEKVMK